MFFIFSILQIPGCSNSGLFKAFSDYLLGKLKIIQERDIKKVSTKLQIGTNLSTNLSDSGEVVEYVLEGHKERWKDIVNPGPLCISKQKGPGIEIE